MNIETIIKLVKLLRPKYYNILTRLLVISGLTLLTKPFWVDILNIILGEFKFSLIGEFDWLLGLIIITIALIYNTYHRYLDLQYEYKNEPAHNKVDFKIFDKFGELCQEILPLLRDNEYIFKSTGPNSSSYELEPLRTDFTMWEQLKKEAILPNNEAIKKLINDNKKLIPGKYENEFNKMLLHINAFNQHIINPNFDYSEYQFPKEFSNIILIVCFESAKTNSNLNKKRKWIYSKLDKKYISDWFIFGSTAFIPDKANDLDIAIKVDKSQIDDPNTLNNNFKELKFDFKLKFKKDLHIALFDAESNNDYLAFSTNNPLKIEKSNG